MSSDTLLIQLEDIADGNLQEGVTRLEEAFALFSRETAHLEQAYSKLQKRFKAVNSQLEESLFELEEKVVQLDLVTHYLNNILHHMHQGILFIGTSGMIMTYNTAAEKILGINHKSAIFQSYLTIFADDFFGFSMKEVLKQLSSPERKLLLVGEKELEIETNCVRKGPKSNQGVLVLIRDITEMRRLQREAERKDRMQELGEMAASVAHEIRNPLGGIQGYASLLHRDLEKQEPLQQMAGHIIEGSKRLSRLVEDVLQYARPIQLKKERVDLSSLLQEVCAFIQVDPNFPTGVSVHLEKPASLYLLLDSELFRAALLNLIYNALQAMPQGGDLIIQLHENKGRVSLSITDTGVGIGPENLEKLFTPYFTTKEKGTGLGLCETYKIVEAHFGTIEVHSHIGKGTTFIIEDLIL